MNTALTIAGSDSGGGAGIQADLKTFAAFGVFGMSAITAITAQNTCGVTNIRELDDEIISDQIEAIFTDIPVDAVKTGMLASAGITRLVAKSLQHHSAKNIVVDPVMVSKNGSRLLKADAIAALKTYLLPQAYVVTPNLSEAAELVGFPVNNPSDMRQAAIAIKKLGPAYVLVKGGHLPKDALDLLYDGSDFMSFTNERIDSPHTHGTGCTFSSAIAAGLAQGKSVVDAITAAKHYITTAIRHGFPLGKGIGPTHHFYELYHKAGIYGNGGE